jgi:enamine deaminase RidA (YjgF/YER057c/UK114 family)
MSAADDPRERLRRLGFDVVPPLPPKGAYAAARRSGSLLFVSGHTGRTADAPALAGVVGDGVSVEEARQSARLAAVNLLSVVAHTIGLTGVSLLQLRGYVRADGGFTDHPSVIDAASQLLAEILADGQMHARAAIGVASLPGGAVVELEAVFEVGS